MSNTPTVSQDEIRRALDEIAKNFQPSNRQRFISLMPYQNQVRELRGQKASFKTIAKLLKRFSVQVTGETVRRFYHIVIAKKSAKRKRTHHHEKRQAKRSSIKLKIPMPLSPSSAAQPRIARIEDL